MDHEIDLASKGSLWAEGIQQQPHQLAGGQDAALIGWC